jgi:transcriptional regulator with XRE-family HTH domain
MARRKTKHGPDPIDKHVGARVRGRRMGMRLSQTKLGETVDVTFQQIQKYENGTNRIGASNLYKISKTLGVDVGFFYEGVEDIAAGDARGGPGLADSAKTSFERDPMSSREAIELMHNYFRIAEPTVRKKLFNLVRSLADSAKTA